MKSLEITMLVKANSTDNAEQIAMRELMNLAKTVSFMGCGSGNATHVSDCVYEVKATVGVATDVSETNITNTIQHTWMNNPDIISSFVYVAHESQNAKEEPKETKKETEVCERCGHTFKRNGMSIVYKNKEDYYYLCENCAEEEDENGNLSICDCCLELIDNAYLVENPVTHVNDICPCCGTTLNI